MNSAIAKVENNLADKSGQARPDCSANESINSLPLDEGALFDENTGRKIYRRSTAYFLFGFGCNQHSIMTDEP